MTRLPADVQDALDRLEPRIRDAFIAAIEQVTSAIRLQQLEAMILAGDMEGAIQSLRLEQGFFGPLFEAVREPYLAGGPMAVSGLRIRDPFDGSRFVFGFDGRHERAERWIREQSSRLITDVIEDQKDMARAVIREGTEAGRHPRGIALDIVGRTNRATGKREGGFLGLTGQQAGWVRNAEAQLRDLDAGYFSRGRRDKRYDGTVRKAIEAGKPLAEADVQRIIGRYKARLLKARGDMIARTEALNGLRAGRWEGFQQLVESGKVRRDQVEVTWSATMDRRTRDSHRWLHGQKVRMGEMFNPAPGVFMRFPGDLESSPGNPRGLAAQTIACRCWAAIRVKSDLLRD